MDLVGGDVTQLLVSFRWPQRRLLFHPLFMLLKAQCGLCSTSSCWHPEEGAVLACWQSYSREKNERWRKHTQPLKPVLTLHCPQPVMLPSLPPVKWETQKRSHRDRSSSEDGMQIFLQTGPIFQQICLFVRYPTFVSGNCMGNGKHGFGSWSCPWTNTGLSGTQLFHFKQQVIYYSMI